MSLQDQVDRNTRALQNTTDPNSLTANQVMPSGGSVVVVNPNTNEFETIPEEVSNGQRSFYNEFSKKINYDAMYIRRENSLGWLNIMWRKGNRHLTWLFRNNEFDDYMILGDSYVGDSVLGDRSIGLQNYGTLSGTWYTTSPNAHFTATIDDTFTTVLTTSKVNFAHYADNRGGIWEFVIDGDTANAVTISTYSTTPLAPQKVILFDNLAFEEHTIVGTFKGDDPNNVPSGGAGTSRGWVWFGTPNDPNNKTFENFQPDFINTRETDLAQGFSNKEYALQVRLQGDTNDYEYLPMHAATGTVFNVNPTNIQVDGQSIDIMDSLYDVYQECSSITVTQDCVGRNTNTVQDLMKIDTLHRFNSNAKVTFTGSFNSLEDLEINIGYGGMLPVHNQNFDKLITSLTTSYAATLTDGSRTNLEDELDAATSFVFRNSASPNYFISIDYLNPNKTLRQEAINKGDLGETCFLEHRDVNVAKLYNKLYQATEISKGNTLNVSLVFYSGSIN